MIVGLLLTYLSNHGVGHTSKLGRIEPVLQFILDFVGV